MSTLTLTPRAPQLFDPTQTLPKHRTSRSLSQIVNDVSPAESRVLDSIILERPLGNNETSYYLPSRESGVNDMYLHLGFRATAGLRLQTRLSIIWAIMRLRHPLLASSVQMHSYEDIRFVYKLPQSAAAALQNAKEALEFCSLTKDELIDRYLNGSRTLSDNRLSYLILSTIPEPNEDAKQHELIICATHFLGDGMALHTFANDIFTLIGGKASESELRIMLDNEWETRHNMATNVRSIPPSLESRLPKSPNGVFRRIAEKVDFQRDQDRLIGGQTFPRRKGLRHTVVPTVSFDEEKTKKILKKCKANGVSISAALFALCNFSWARMNREKPILPMMMYSALNIRPFLEKCTISDSYWFLAVGYFNVILPSWLPASSEDQTRIFWHRSKQAKEQSNRASKSKMLISRTREMTTERCARARVWAKEDDERAAGTYVPTQAKQANTSKPPSSALIGLSLLGNLDGMYRHPEYPDIKLNCLTTGSRQRAGGMLMFGYTFAGKLWISLGYDENGFDQSVVNRFWQGVIQGVDEFLI